MILAYNLLQITFSWITFIGVLHSGLFLRSEGTAGTSSGQSCSGCALGGVGRPCLMAHCSWEEGGVRSVTSAVGGSLRKDQCSLGLQVKLVPLLLLSDGELEIRLVALFLKEEVEVIWDF